MAQANKTKLLTNFVQNRPLRSSSQPLVIGKRNILISYIIEIFKILLLGRQERGL